MATFIKAGFWEKTCNPCNGYKGWLNLDQFVSQAGSSGTSGVNGPEGPQGVQGTQGIQGLPGANGSSGTSGLTGDRYQTTSTTEFTLGTSTTLTIGTGLAYTPAQDIIITYDINNHQVCSVVSYNSGTGALVIGPPVTVTGSGTYSSWTVNLEGAAGGDGSSGTSGANGSSGTSGAQGSQGVQGIQGVSGSNGTSGSTGSNGTSGSNGSSGTNGTSATLPVSVNYGLYAQTANSTIVTNTTTETTIIGTGVGTLSVPANGFTVGDTFRAVFGGIINANNNETIRIKVKAGSVILLDSGLENLGSAVIDDVWSLNVDFTIRQLGAAGVASIVSLGSFHYTKTNNASVQGFGFNVLNNTTFDTTISNTLDVTVEWGTASTGNNIYSDIFILNKTY
jgi:hypothetical protein